MKNTKYDYQRPLDRLEVGDSAIIKIRHHDWETSAQKKKYYKVPDGAYVAKVVAPYVLECEEYPVLSGTYCALQGKKHGCGGLITADEIGFGYAGKEKNV